MKPGRWALLTAVALMFGVAAVWLYRTGPGLAGFAPGCVLRKTTGFHCPGCGMTRATYALLHGDLPAAVSFNPVGSVLLPVALGCLGLEMIAWARGKPWPFRLMPGPKLSVFLAVLVIGFGLVRNLPWWPFTLLVPH